jgi:hypothetical protein
MHTDMTMGSHSRTFLCYCSFIRSVNLDLIAVIHILPTPKSVFMSFTSPFCIWAVLVDKMTMVKVFFMYSCFPRQFSFYQLLHINRSSCLRCYKVLILAASLNNQPKLLSLPFLLPSFQFYSYSYSHINSYTFNII